VAGKNLTADQLKVLALRLADVGETCRRLREAGIKVVADGDGSDNAFHGQVVEKLAEHAGALVDSCLTVLEGNGLGVICGDFIDWRMSPLEREHVERMSR
jgi:hypothetical protein